MVSVRTLATGPVRPSAARTVQRGGPLNGAPPSCAHRNGAYRRRAYRSGERLRERTTTMPAPAEPDRGGIDEKNCER